MPTRPDLGGPITAMSQYGEELEAFIRAEMQPQIDAAHAETETLRAEFEAYKASHPDTPPPPDPDPKPTVRKIIGLSAPANLWDQRLREVGPEGITARRIFANFTSTGKDQAALIEAAVKAKMMPVVSYKGTPTAANIAAVRAYLTSLGVPVTATWHHEPHNDMTPAEFRDGSKAFLAVKSGLVKVGPILNGWLLDRRVADFESYTSPELLDAWDFLGLDSYQSGTAATPGDSMPARAIPLAVKFLAERGHAGMPILLGEYNGHTAAAIKEAGDTILAEPSVWVACAWNSTGDKYSPLVGDRLEAFKATKADSRVQK